MTFSFMGNNFEKGDGVNGEIPMLCPYAIAYHKLTMI